MIEGLKVTVKAAELRQLCKDRAAHHADRAIQLKEQAKQASALELESVNRSGGDPATEFERRQKEHEANADEMRFIAEHLAEDDYRLDLGDLQRLGVVRSRY